MGSEAAELSIVPVSQAEGKIPKPILAARAKIQALGLELTAENIKAALTKEELNKAAGAFRTTMKNHQDAQAQYKGASTDVAKFGFLAKFIINPNIAQCFGQNTFTRSSVDGEEGKRVWLSINQMKGPMYYNDESDAIAIAENCESRGDSRPHEDPTLAALGKKQFLVTLSHEMWKRHKGETATLSTKAELAPADFNTVKRSMMGDESNIEAKARPPKKHRLALEDMTPNTKEKHEQKLMKQKAASALKLALTALNKLYNTVQRDIADGKRHSASLIDKGFPKEMTKYFDDHFDPVLKAAETAWAVWTEHSKYDTQLENADGINEVRCAVEAATKDLDATLKGVDSKLKDVKKMAPQKDQSPKDGKIPATPVPKEDKIPFTPVD